MAEPADTVCIVIGDGGTSGVGTGNVSTSNVGIGNLGTSNIGTGNLGIGNVGTVGLSCSTALSGFPSLLQNFLKLFPLICILALPENETNNLRSEKKTYLARLSKHGP